jgi:hypothetical protein
LYQLLQYGKKRIKEKDTKEKRKQVMNYKEGAVAFVLECC